MKRAICQAIFLLAMLFGTIGAIPAQGAVIYSQTQPEEPFGAYSSQEREVNGQVIADNFMISGNVPIAVYSLRFIGGYGLTAPPLGTLPNDDFRIVFLEDANGSPGDLVTGGDFKSAEVVVKSYTGGALLNGVYEPMEYGINLSGAVMLNPSVSYWLSITNNTGDDFFWVWARANGVGSSRLASTFNGIESEVWQVSGGGMWYELNTLPVPEPPGIVLFVISMVLSESFCLRLRQGE